MSTGSPGEEPPASIPPTPSTPSTVALRSRRARARRFRVALSLVWLLWLVWPVVDVLTSDRPMWMVVPAIGLTAAFVALYALGVAYGYGGRSERVPQIATVALAVITLGLAPLIGGDSAAYLIFTVVLVVFAWPVRISLPAVAGLVVWAAVLPALVDGDGSPRWFFPVLVGGTGLAMYAARRMVVQQGEIERAHEQLADLAVADERARFARDLHDVLGHSLTAIAVKAELAGKLVDRDAERAQAEIADIGRLAREGLEDVRRTAADTREVSLAAELVSARVALAAAGIAADLPQALDAVPGPRRELFGWAVREGVTNVVRHSGATRCEIRLTAGAVNVLDDGRGDDDQGAAPAAGNGLRGLAERAAAAGATLEAESVPGGGYRLRVSAGPAAVQDRAEHRAGDRDAPAAPGAGATSTPRAERVP